MNIKTEFHPRIKKHDEPLAFNKIILGSFPPFNLTVDTEINDLPALDVRINNGDIQFFYGSTSNMLWDWYKKHFDESVNVKNILSIKESLIKNRIGITDVISSCTRQNHSALDKHLKNRTYNHKFFNYPVKGSTLKILCTSKGVLNDMLLTPLFFSQHKELKINIEQSSYLQSQIIQRIDANEELIKKPFARVIETLNGGRIECIATPSPGSPYRKLKDFGLAEIPLNEFLERFLKEAFLWFKN